jgi:hypothetical protein
MRTNSNLSREEKSALEGQIERALDDLHAVAALTLSDGKVVCMSRIEEAAIARLGTLDLLHLYEWQRRRSLAIYRAAAALPPAARVTAAFRRLERCRQHSDHRLAVSIGLLHLRGVSGFDIPRNTSAWLRAKHLANAAEAERRAQAAPPPAEIN